MKIYITGLVFLTLLGGCSGQNSAKVITDKCVEDGMKIEGCSCLVSLMEKHLPPKDIKDLAKAAISGNETNGNMDRLLAEIDDKMKVYMESLPTSEKIKVGTDVAVETAKCTPKLF